jgi:hypothetical protein
MSDASVAVHFLANAIESLLSHVGVQGVDKDAIQAHIDAARTSAGTPLMGAIDTVKSDIATGATAVIEAAKPEVQLAADATIPVIGGMIAGELIPIANQLLSAGEGKLEAAIAALFHVSGAGQNALSAATVAVSAGTAVAQLPQAPSPQQ